MKKLFSFIVVFLLLVVFVPTSSAQSVQACREQVVVSLENVMGLPGRNELHGYLQQLSDLTSTNLATHLLIPQIEQLARDARLEMQGICQEVGRFDEMNQFYSAAYGLNQCRGIVASEGELAAQLNIIELCESRSEDLQDALLDDIREYVLRQAVRTSMDPVIQKMRSLNSRLVVLISEYSRLVNNFFTFSFRLGDTIIGERD